MKTKQDQSKPHSITNVYNVQRVFSGIRGVASFRCDTGLYSAFKEVAKARFGSVCFPLEIIMTSVIGLNSSSVNFGNTLKIEHLTIERNLKPRRNLVVDEDELLSEGRAELMREAEEKRRVDLKRELEKLDSNFIEVASIWRRQKPENKAFWLRRAKEHPELPHACKILELDI